MKTNESCQAHELLKTKACFQTHESTYVPGLPDAVIDSYTTFNLKIQIENFGAYDLQNELRLDAFEDTEGNWYCSGAAIINSSIVVKFECKTVNISRGFEYISYNILHFLCCTALYVEQPIFNLEFYLLTLWFFNLIFKRKLFIPFD